MMHLVLLVCEDTFTGFPVKYSERVTDSSSHWCLPWIYIIVSSLHKLFDFYPTVPSILQTRPLIFILITLHNHKKHLTFHANQRTRSKHRYIKLFTVYVSYSVHTSYFLPTLWMVWNWSHCRISSVKKWHFHKLLLSVWCMLCLCVSYPLLLIFE